jgi:hypothetical protein
MKICISFVLAVLITTGLRAQTDAKQEMVVPLSEPGKPCKVSVSTMWGSIKVTTYEGKDVVVEAEGEKKHESSSSAGGGMKRIGGGGAEVTAEENGNSVTIDAGQSHILQINVKVPHNTTELKVDALNNGTITVSNVIGQLEVNNVNGGIHLEGISGSVVANTVNGDVVVGFNSADPHAAMAFSTLNGKVDVSFPADLKANVKLQAEQGDVYSDFDVEIDKGHNNAEKSTEGHMYRITIDDWVYGKINGGGPEIMMKTTNGSVYIRKGK